MMENVQLDIGLLILNPKATAAYLDFISIVLLRGQREPQFPPPPPQKWLLNSGTGAGGILISIINSLLRATPSGSSFPSFWRAYLVLTLGLISARI